MFFHPYSISPSNRVMTLLKDESWSHSSAYFEEYSNNRALHPAPINRLTKIKSVVLRDCFCLNTEHVMHPERSFLMHHWPVGVVQIVFPHKDFPLHAPWLEGKYTISLVFIGFLMQPVSHKHGKAVWKSALLIQMIQFTCV